MTRQSNFERAKWRQKCRQLLSQHIVEELKLNIQPEQVRLLPKEDDLYRWEVPDARKHLFKKNLSKHSIGPLMELCREVGLSFRAVHHQQDASSVAQVPLPCEIQRENSDLTEELRLTRQRAEVAEERLLHLVQAFKVIKRKDARKTAFILRIQKHMSGYIHESSAIAIE